MSLINEALKKAQKQRTGEAPPLPAIGGESAERIRSKSTGSGAPLLRLGIGGAVVAGVVIGAVLFLQRKPSAPPAAPAPAPAPVVSTPPPVAKAPEPAVATNQPAQPAPASATPPPVAFTVPTAPVSAPTAASTRTETPAPAPEVPKTAVIPASTAAAPVTAAASTPAPAAAAPIVLPAPEPAKAAPPPANKLEPRAINFIESLRVAGIRASSTDSKVLMNDRVYRIGSIVEHEMGLKLTGITANSLTFEDERGVSYTRTF